MMSTYSQIVSSRPKPILDACRLDTLRAGISLETGRTLRSNCADVTFGAGDSYGADRPLGSSEPDVALRPAWTHWSLRTHQTLRSGEPLWSHSARIAFGSRFTFWTNGTGFALWPRCSLRTRGTVSDEYDVQRRFMAAGGVLL